MGHPFDPQRVLQKPLMATLGTIAADGSPRTAPVWYHWEADALHMLGSDTGSSSQRILADPRVSVEITDYDNAAGRLLHLGLRGRAEIIPMDGDLFRRLLDRYLGARETWNAWFIDTIAAIDDPSGRLIRLVPQSVFTNNVSYFRTGPDFAA
ncbi:MAG: pyridoxamine 5'-phosphate oxidase family protein [Pseudomonadota bacterium]